MNYRYLLLSLLFVLFTFSAKTQVLPPDFLCVTNDTLVWAPVSNTCGPFNAYQVFGSNDENGPYTLLASIPDPAETTFFHADANNQTWYYYLNSDNSCPLEEVINSDTLDNLIPLAGPLTLVTVLGGGVEIDWDPSPSPETFAYIISRNTSSGTTVLDTVFGATNYTDLTGDPDLGSETYFVVALDPCGNKSLVVDPHNTVFLESTTPDPCDPNIELSWNAYQNWSGGVERYEVFVSVDGGAASLIGDTDANTTSFTYGQGNDGEQLCFYVEAIEAGTELRSRSSITCQDVSILQPMRFIYLLGTSVNADGSVTYQWVWDDSALLTEAGQNSTRNGNDVVEVTTFDPGAPLIGFNERTDLTVDANIAGYTYELYTFDECTRKARSNSSETIFLSGTAPGDGTNVLDWNPYIHDYATDVILELVKDNGTSQEVIFTGSAADVKFIDEIDLSGPEASGVCYFIRATVTYALPNGEVIEQTILSNIVCLEQVAKVFVPNVFAPRGVNSVFRPQLGFGTAQEYLLEIYDRWGGQVFESRELNTGWNGQKNGEQMPQGVYVYRIRLVQSSGEVVELMGDVMLLW